MKKINAQSFIQESLSVSCFFLVLLMLAISSFSLTATLEAIAQESTQTNATTSIPTGLNDFLVYDNATWGFKVQYPSNWEIIEGSKSGIIQFVSPLESDADKYGQTVTVSLTVFNETTSLNEVISNTTRLLEEVTNDFFLIVSNSTTLSGLPAHVIQYRYSDPFKGITDATVIFTIEENQYLYSLAFHSKPDKYVNLIPIIERMTNSFEIYTAPL